MIKIIRKLLNGFFQVLGLPYNIVKKVLEVTVIGVKKAFKFIGSAINTLANIVNTVLKGIINILLIVLNWITKGYKFITKYLILGIKYLPKILKAVGIWFIKAIKESLAQIFTLLGFFIAWLTLTGSAKDIVGIAIIISTALWLLTIGLREDD